MYNVDPDNFKDGVELWSQATQLELDDSTAVGEITKLLTPVISKISTNTQKAYRLRRNLSSPEGGGLPLTKDWGTPHRKVHRTRDWGTPTPGEQTNIITKNMTFPSYFERGR